MLNLLTQHAAPPGGSGSVQLQPEAAFESWFESTSSRSSAQADPNERSSRHRAFESTRTSSQVDVDLHLARISSATRHTTQEI